MRRVCTIIIIFLALPLTACDAGDPNEPAAATGVATTAPTPVGPATPIVAPTRETVTEDGLLVSDGVCQARVPLTWSEDAPGTGTTGGGHAFSVFGNPLAAEGAWQTALALLKEQAARRPDAQIIEGADDVRITYANGAGFAYRRHFEGVYCDIRVTGRGGPISEGERATWDDLIASLEPVT